MPFTVRNIIDGATQPVCVTPTDSVQYALGLMIEKDYSQLPVKDAADKPLGLLTSDSILRALDHFGLTVEELRVDHAMAKAVIRRSEDDLFEMLDALRDTPAVLIVDGDGKLTGIVTSYDTTEYFRRRAEDIMLVEDIESALREHIEAAFTDASSDEVNQAALSTAIQDVTDRSRALRGRFCQGLKRYLSLRDGKAGKLGASWVDEAFGLLVDETPARTLSDLTLYDHIQLLLHKDCTDYYTRIFGLDANAIRKLLDGVRQARNDLAHFRGEISASQREKLRFSVDWLERHPPSIPVAWPAYEAEAAEEPLLVREDGATYLTRKEKGDEIAPVEEALGPGDSRYARLAIWLQGRAPRQDRVQLNFEEIEAIIGSELPSSARRHSAWWANDTVSHTQSREWLDAGWRKGQLNMTEQWVTFVRVKSRERAYIGFFSDLQSRLRERPSFPLKQASPDGQSWLTAASLPGDGPQSLYFTFSFARKKRFRVELYIDTADKAQNKRIFDQLHAQRDQLGTAMGAGLSWERLDERRASRVAVYHPGSITDDEGELAQLHAWAADMMLRFYETFAGLAQEALLITQDDTASG
jgi:CBS domain-containing protein